MNAPRNSPPAARRRRRSSTLARVVVLWALLMAPLLTWGLPSSKSDDLLFGDSPAWDAARYNVKPALEQLGTRNAGADVDLNPLTDRDRIIDLTPDDAARAEILRRYRLYSRQPDEMIIFRALERMHPRQLDLDPKLYQYGGGYIYLVGASLGAAALVRLVHLTADACVYLDHPGLVANFYLVARFVSLVFGALTLIAVHRLARRAGGRSAGWIALVYVACSPVFITAVLEAKPHLPSACMILWATLSALDYRARGHWQDALHVGWRAGYAFGLVLTGCLAALLWPVLFLARPAATRRRTLAQLAAAAGLALGVYALTNPYVLYNWLADRAALSSNIANSTAMYQDQVRHSLQGAVRAGQLLIDGAGLGVPVVGVIGLAWLLRRRSAATTIAAAPGVGMLLLCILLAAGKPAEFARFLILPALLLSAAAGCLLATLLRRRLLLGVLATLAVLVVMHTTTYVRSFWIDARGPHESRRLAGDFLAAHAMSEETVGVLQEPAPYAVPPLDFAHRRVFLLPPLTPLNLDRRELPGWLVFTADDEHTHAGAWWHHAYELVARFPASAASLSRIAWANKPVFVYRRTP